MYLHHLVINKQTVLISVSLVLSLFLIQTASAQSTISKCQDEQGKWHYGDYASEACAARSNITEIDYQGNQVRETNAPPTEEELKKAREEKQRKEKEAKERAEQQRLNNQLLTMYDSEESIIRIKQNRVDAIQRNVEANELFKQDLQEEVGAIEVNEQNQTRINDLKQQIQEYDLLIQSLYKEREDTELEFNDMLERYRSLTQ